MAQSIEVQMPIAYELAIDHICEFEGLIMDNPAHRRKAYFHLERVVRRGEVRCALTFAGSSRPVRSIRSFRLGHGLDDLAAVQGDIEDTIYDEADLEKTFPLNPKEDLGTAAGEPALDEPATDGDEERRRVRQPPKMWEMFAFELGIHLGSGGDAGDVREFVRDYKKKRSDFHADRTTIWRHVDALMDQWKQRLSS